MLSQACSHQSNRNCNHNHNHITWVFLIYWVFDVYIIFIWLSVRSHRIFMKMIAHIYKLRIVHWHSAKSPFILFAHFDCIQTYLRCDAQTFIMCIEKRTLSTLLSYALKSHSQWTVYEHARYFCAWISKFVFFLSILCSSSYGRCFMFVIQHSKVIRWLDLITISKRCWIHNPFQQHHQTTWNQPFNQSTKTKCDSLLQFEIRIVEIQVHWAFYTFFVIQ